MAQTDLLKRYLDAGIAFTQLSQQKAEEIVRDLVKSGEVQASEAQARVSELVDRSRQNTESLLAKVGLVPKKEVDALRKELADLKAKQASTGPVATPAQKVVAKKAAPAKKAPAAKPSPATKAGGGSKGAPVKSSAKKSPATKAAKAADVATNLP